MDGPDGTSRVEIELVAHERSGRHRRRGRDTTGARADVSGSAPAPLPGSPLGTPPFGDAPPAVVGGVGAPVEHGPLGSERARLVVTALASGVVALLIGWALGRSGGDGGTSSVGEAQPTTPVSTVPPEQLGATVPPVDPEVVATLPPAPVGPGGPETTEPSTAGPRITTTTAPPGWVVEVGAARVAAEAAALDISIVGMQRDGTLIELDTATGDLATMETSFRAGRPTANVFAGSDWIVAGAADSNSGVWIGADGEPQPILVGFPWQFHHQPGTDRFWRIDEPTRYGVPYTVHEVTHDGTETGVTFDVDGRYWIVGSDAAGGVVVASAPGGSYHVGPEGSYRITTGQVLTLDNVRALSVECGEQLGSCGLVVVDRASGATTPLTLTVLEPTIDLDRQLLFESPANYGFPSLLTGLSPDGRYSPIIIIGPDQDYGVVDLTTGEFIQLGDQPESGVWWAPDSRSVMYLINGHLLVYDFDTRTTYEVSQDIYPLASFAVRPKG